MARRGEPRVPPRRRRQPRSASGAMLMLPLLLLASTPLSPVLALRVPGSAFAVGGYGAGIWRSASRRDETTKAAGMMSGHHPKSAPWSGPGNFHGDGNGDGCSLGRGGGIRPFGTPPPLGMLRGGSDGSADGPDGGKKNELRSSASEVVEAEAVAPPPDEALNGGTSTVADNANGSSHTIGSKVLATDSDFIKSRPDSRSYRAVTLPNGLTVLLVSDPETDVEAGSVHINSGHFQDPTNRPGLAHFHEHMLFLGTEKYPGEDDWEAYLGRNGGSSNAYTDMEDTNYYFSVAPLDHDEDNEEDGETTDEDGGGTSSALSGALDRLSQFFISPLFNPEMVERELRAINSEYLNSVSSDSWRNYQLLKSYANPDHPFHKFGCGSYATLTDGGDIKGERAELSGGTNPRDDLVKFWEDNYQTPKMRLCVVGRAGLDDLQRTVEETFGRIAPPSAAWLEKFQAPPSDPPDEEKLFQTENAMYKVPSFDHSNLGLIREVVPVVESRIIKLQFGTPPLEDPKLVKSRPYRVLSHLLGHESPGSLHSLLNDEGLINSFSSGVGIDTEDFSLCSLTVSLTPKGMRERDRVLSLIWQWISLIKSSVGNDEHGLMEKYHDEMRAISQVSFEYRENGDPTDFCSAAAGLLFHYEPSKILAGSSLTGEYDTKVAKAFLDRFTPRNCLITVWDPDLEKGSGEDAETSASSAQFQKEKWYGALHRQVRIPDAVAESWDNPTNIDPRLKLPNLNEFIPSDFSLRCNDPKSVENADPSVDYRTQPPAVLLERPDLRLWHKMDRTFRVPKTYLRVELTSPCPYQSPRSMTLNRLYQKVLRDDLNEFVYDASVAGCNYRVTCVPLGYRVSVSGYSEKLPHLLDVVTSRMLSLIEEMKKGPDASPALAQKFEKARHNLARQTKNFRLESPYETCSYISRMLVEDNVWHVDQYVDEMEGDYAEKHPLTMEECARAAEESLLGRGKAEAICMGNINEEEALKVADVVSNHFLQSRPLSEDEVPKFRSLKMPTMDEATEIFGPEVASSSIPVKIEQVAYSESEKNNACQVIIQTGSEHTLSWEGIATQELLSYIAYNSAYNQLRTKEQLGYIVSAFTRKNAGGANALSIVVQSSTALPATLEERCEAWLETFRKEIEAMSEERIAMEAAAVVAQLLERDMKLGDEVSSAWGEILATETLSEKVRQPVFDRLERLAKYLTIEDGDNGDESVSGGGGPSTKVTAAQLKKRMIDFFDKYLSSSSPTRRAFSARVYCQKSKEVFENNVGKPGILSSYADSRYLKQFLSSYPTAPYWIK